jgi:primary-amine oxidase
LDTTAALKASQRERIPAPTERFDFLPDLRGPNFKPRSDITPLHIVQPEGVSFAMRGNELDWQKWKMHVGKNPNQCLVFASKD